MYHHNIARFWRDVLLHKYMKTAKINTNVIESRQPAIIARNSIWKQQCWDRHVFSTHKALNPSQSIPFLLLMATWILPFKSGEKTKLLLQHPKFEQVHEVGICHHHVSSSPKTGIAWNSSKENYKYKNTTKQMSPIIHNQIHKKSEAQYGSNKTAVSHSHYIFFCWCSICMQIRYSHSDQETRVSWFTEFYIRTSKREICICHRHVSSSPGRGIASHSFKKQQV